jgi:hypothetical protein
MTVDEALETLRELADPATIEGKAAYHKIDRPYIGTNNQILNDIGKEWRHWPVVCGLRIYSKVA